MGMALALTHGHTVAMLFRQVGEVWIQQGALGVGVWMPLGQHGPGPVPGWRAAMALLVGMGVDLSVEPEECDADLDGRAGYSLVWDAPDADPLPGGCMTIREFLFDPATGYTIRTVTAEGGEPDVTATTRLWHVGFHTAEHAARLDRRVEVARV